MSKHILIYGANGYTAELIIDLAVKDGLNPILAGRTLSKIEPIARRHGLPYRSFGLDEPKLVANNLLDVAVVLNCAGPFTRTAQLMAEACIQTGTHYLDITGEIDVFELLAKMGVRAKAKGVMLMPGVGFDVVPSDCLAAHLKRRMPDAVSLTLAFQVTSRPSHGTATTMIENLHSGGQIRKDGKLTPVPSGWAVREIDFGRGSVKCMSIPWGDVSTAWVSTSIPDIQVYMAAPLGMRMMAKASRYLGSFLETEFVRNFLKKKIDAGPPGPDSEQRRRGASHFWGEVRGVDGKSMSSRLDTIDGYGLTALTAWDIAKRTVDSQNLPGFQTPSQVFGADYILNFAGSKRVDS
jgi:short subunit dehydrogenase-like uncharacterized protein